MNKTLSIIKPDATKRNITGKVNSIIEGAGLKIIAQKKMWLSKAQAEQFYAVHSHRPFFNDLVSFMISGPVVVQVLEAKEAVALYRNIMGATNPENAEPGTIRKELALNIEENTVHGSDSDENAEKEIAFFFSGIEIVG
jgi:nucleoside-diphosphate kinase